LRPSAFMAAVRRVVASGRDCCAFELRHEKMSSDTAYADAS
jgi:hypothetical protein